MENVEAAAGSHRNSGTADHPRTAHPTVEVKPGSLVTRCRDIVESTVFQVAVLGVIVLNAVIIGLETSPALDARFGRLFYGLSHLAQILFTIEIAIRLTAHWPRPLRFFRDGWNTFDFTVVAIAFIPATAGLTNLARVARILRATRLVSALPHLRLIFDTLVRSIPSIGHVLALLALLVYLYGIVGYHLFATTDPDRWGTLGAALFTLFQVLTLEGWNDIHAALSPEHRWSWLFFGSFIVVAVFVVANLALAVIITSLEAAKLADAHQFDREVPGSPMGHIEEIRAVLLQLEEDIRAVGEEVRDRDRDPTA